MMKRTKLFFAVLIAMMGIVYAGYSFLQKKETIKLYVKFMRFSNTPIINVTIQGNEYPFAIDLGASVDCLDIRKNVFKNIKKSPIAEAVTVDVNKNTYKKKIFKIPQVNVGSYVLRDATASEEVDSLLTEGGVMQIPSDPEESSPRRLENARAVVGRVGKKFFQGEKFLFDFVCMIFPMFGEMLMVFWESSSFCTRFT